MREYLNQYLNKDDNQKNIFSLFMFLYIFNSVNKIFKPLNIDLRFIVLPLSLFLIIKHITNNKGFTLDFISKRIVFLYLFSVLSIITLFFYFSSFDVQGLMNLAILNVYNLMCVFTLSLYRKNINFEQIYKMLSVSIIVLAISMIVTLFFKDINFIFGVDYNAWVPQKNFLGFNMRIGGYAQDPNYAAFWLLTYLIVMYRRDHSYSIKKIIVSLTLLFLYLLTSSKTILIAFISAIILSLLFNALKKLGKEKWSYLFKILLVYVTVTVIIISIMFFKELLPFNGMDTMSTRYSMWEKSVELFKKSPLIGTGLSTFRNYFEQSGFWYVQSHSTIFQLISETGLIGLTLFLSVILSLITIDDWAVITLGLTVFLMSITNEIIYLPFLIIINLIRISIDKVNKPNSHIYLINSTTGGGAEKVVNDLSKESAKTNRTFVITIEETPFERRVPNVEYIHLSKEKGNNTISNLIKLINMKFNLHFELMKIDNSTCIELYTNHLPRTQMIAKFNKYQCKSSYIIHGSPSLTYSNKTIAKLISKALFSNMKVGYVSADIEEYLADNKIKTKSNYFVLNPINASEVRDKAQAYDVNNNNYVLYIGRMDKNKNPIKTVEIFNHLLKINRDIKLVMLGTGEEEDDVKEKIRELDIESSVDMLGFVSNPYPYILKSSCIINSSTSEAQPVTILEALLLNVNVFGTRSGKWVDEILPENIKENFNSNDSLDICIKINEYLMKDYIVSLDEDRFDVKNVLNDYIQKLGVRRCYQ